MDQSLDDILAEHKAERRGRRNDGRRGDRNNNNNNSDRNDRGTGRRRGGDRRDDFPRDGVRKTYRDEPRKIDEEWVHDRYEDDARRKPRQRSPDSRRPAHSHTAGTRLRVENLHYDLTTEDLDGLFRRIGPVIDVHLVYDRAGRSEGLAYVTYSEYDDARQAVREFDGANAKGQPIRLSIVPNARNNNSNSSVGAGRPLAERISRPKTDDYDDDDGDDSRTSLASAARRGIDRYVPGEQGHGGNGGGRLSRSRSPVRRREGGRRPGDRRGGRGGRDRDGQNGRDDSNRDSNRGDNNGQNGRRPKKTQEELDAEMADYFVESGNGAEGDAAASAPAAAAPAAAVHDDGDDADMIG